MPSGGLTLEIVLEYQNSRITVEEENVLYDKMYYMTYLTSTGPS